MTFKPMAGRTRGVDTQQTAIHPSFQIETNRAHVAQNLAGRFLESEVEAAFSAFCCRVGKMRGKTGFAGTRSSRNENAAVAEEPFSAQHAVEPTHAAGDAVGGSQMRESNRGDRYDGEAGFIEQERILVRSVSRTAILNDTQPSRRNLLGHTMIEANHAISHILFKAISCEGAAACAGLGSDDRRDALFLEPAKQSPQFGTNDRFVRKSGKQDFNGVEHQAPRADAANAVLDTHKESGE